MKKKNLFMLMIRHADDPPDQYRMLTKSGPYDKTVNAIKGIEDALIAEDINVREIVKNHGGLRVTVCQFTHANDYHPADGYSKSTIDVTGMLDAPVAPAIPPAPKTTVEISTVDASVSPETPKAPKATKASKVDNTPKAPEPPKEADGEDFWEAAGEETLPEKPKVASSTSPMPAALGVDGDSDIII